MAYTRIHAIKRTLDKALTYVMNPEKTDGQLLISGYNVNPQTAALEMAITQAQAKQIFGEWSGKHKESILAYHMIQSFAPTDNVTPEQAHALGKQLAEQFLGGKYEYVIATHIDKGHIHNHIIFNATSFYDFRKFRTNPKYTAAQLRAISDRICSDAGLSVIKTRKQLGRAYQYKESKTHYRRDIRKRLRFILETATDYKEYQAAVKALGIEMDDERGKYTTYKMPGQARGVRDRSLDKDGAFERKALEETLAQNAERLPALQEKIRNAAAGAADYNDFVKRLSENGVVCKRIKNGTAKYIVSDADTEDVTVREWALGAAYSTDAIKAAIETGDFSFEEEGYDRIDWITESFQDLDAPSPPTVTIRLQRSNVVHTTEDGLLASLPGPEGMETVFFDRSFVKYIEKEDAFDVTLTTNYGYIAQMPDKNVRRTGEDILRSVELHEGVAPEILELYGADIQSVSQKGVTISIPEYGMQKFFVPAEYVEYDRRFGGICRIALWQRWSYSFTDMAGARKYVLGKDLIEQLQKRQATMDGSLAGRITAMQRRNLVAETRQLADTLNLLRRERINSVDDFDRRVDALLNRAGELQEQVDTIRKKNMQYKQAAKYLMLYDENKPFQLDLMLKRTSTSREAYKRKHESELKALEHAEEQLEKMGVNPDVDPEKVMELVRQQDEEIRQLVASSQEMTRRVMEIRMARNMVETIRMPQQPKKQPQERTVQDRDEEAP